MNEVEKRLHERIIQGAKEREEAETWEEHVKKQQEEHLRELEEAEKGFRNDLIRELRVANRLKAIEILSGASITAIGADYAFLIGISTQWCGTDAEINGVAAPGGKPGA